MSQQTTIDFGDDYSATAQKPPQYTAAPEFGFMSFEQTQSGYADVSGAMAHAPMTNKGQYDRPFADTSSSHYHKLGSGRATNFLNTRGFGWLTEVEDEDEHQTPLLEELDIDLTDIYYKIRCVLLPLPYFRLKLTLVRDSPDFWGPLMVVIAFALLSLYGQMSVVSWIITFWFCGSYVIFFLARMLGGDVGYTQCLGIIGYCLIPLVVTGTIVPLLSSFHWAAMAVKAFGVCWSVYSAGILICVENLQNKRSLIFYPVFLLYVHFLSLYTGV